MYALNENFRFPIYWTDNLLLVFDFDYDKLNILERRALSVLEAFRVVKVKDFLYMADDSEQISKFLVNAYIRLLLSSSDLII